MSDALVLFYQNTAGQGAQTPTWFLKQKTQSEDGHIIQPLPSLPIFQSNKSFTPATQMHWPAFGYVAISISSGLAWKFWMFSQFSVKYLVIWTPWKSKSTDRVNSIYRKKQKERKEDKKRNQNILECDNKNKAHAKNTDLCQFADIEDIHLKESFCKCCKIPQCVVSCSTSHVYYEWTMHESLADCCFKDRIINRKYLFWIIRHSDAAGGFSVYCMYLQLFSRRISTLSPQLPPLIA